MPSTIDIDADAHELIRRQALSSAAADLERAANELHRLEAQSWPIEGDDARAGVRRVRESLDALDAVGWPDTDGE
jgi:hypothetical protein